MSNACHTENPAPADTSAPATHENRVCVIGCGRVGMASAYALIQSSFIRELVLVGRSPERTEGEVMDLEHAVAVPMKPPVKVIHGDYAEAARSSVVVVTAGEATSGPGMSRLDLLSKNIGIVRDIAVKLKAEGFAGVLVMASNPVDILAQVAQEACGLPAGQVIGTGTLIDTARLRGLLAEELGVEPRGGRLRHRGARGLGDRGVERRPGRRRQARTLPRRAGAPGLRRLLDRVRRAGPEVVRRKGHTAYAIGLCVQRICEAVLRNERAVLAVSALLQGEYGIEGVYLGTPCVAGKNGVERVIELDLDAGEREGMQASANLLRGMRQDILEKDGA